MLNDTNMSNYEPHDWYWLRDSGKVYSSARQAEFDDTDELYLEWLQGVRFATRYPLDESGHESEAELAAVLKPFGLKLWPENIDAVKTRYKVAVDMAAENERLKYITPGNGQAMTYQQKMSEARVFKAATNPKASDYPILSSEVGITAETLSDVADIVLAAFSQWQQIGADIESIRLGIKRDIDATEDEAAAHDIVEAIVWPSGI